MMWELWIHNIIKQKEAWDMKQFTTYWLPLKTELKENLPITIKHWNKLTPCIDDVRICGFIISSKKRGHEIWNSSQVADYHWTHWNKLTHAVLMTWELWIHNFIKEKEARVMKQFTSCWLPLNTEINLHAVLMMWELWIHNIIKEKEARNESVHKLLITIEHWNKLKLYRWCQNCGYHQRKGSMRYEKDHKLLITIGHWNKLTRCIDDVRIVDSQYHQSKRKHDIWTGSQLADYQTLK